MPDIETVRIQNMRWHILVALNAARPSGASEVIIQGALAGIPLEASIRDIRRELDYLEDRQLVEIENRDAEFWYASVTRVGVDVVEYTVPCEPGIARPKKYW